MAEEINVGKLVAEIIIEAKTDGADEAVEAISRVNETAAKANPQITISSNAGDVEEEINDIIKKVYQVGKEIEVITIDTDVNDVPAIIDDLVAKLKERECISPEINIGKH